MTRERKVSERSEEGERASEREREGGSTTRKKQRVLASRYRDDKTADRVPRQVRPARVPGGQVLRAS